MSSYLFSAKSPEGKSVTDRIEAATTDAARYALDLRGYREIIFHTDDSSNRVDAVLLAEMVDGGFESRLTPEQEKEARKGGGVLRQLWTAWKLNAVFWIPLSIWIGVNLAGGMPFSAGDIISFVFGGLFLVYFVWLVLPAVGYQCLLAASIWNRLGETRAWARFLRFFGPIGPVRIAKLELDMRLAYVLGRHGLLDEARRLIAPHESVAANNAMILGRLASFYDVIGDHERAHANRTQAVDASSGGLSEIIDHAHGLIRHLRRPQEATTSLNRIGDREVADVARLFVSYTEGLIALEEGRHEESIEKFLKTEQAITPYAANEILNGMLRDIWAFRAIALAKTGRYGEAKELVLKALPMLQARRETILISRCTELLPRFAKTASPSHIR